MLLFQARCGDLRVLWLAIIALGLPACACPCEQLTERLEQCGIVLRAKECTDARERCSECVVERLYEDCSNFGQICFSECGVDE